MTSLLSLFLIACIWDTDTIDDELRGLPSLEVIITDRWYRHSETVYQNRIDTLSTKLNREQISLEEHDDLAVAYERTNQREMALKVLETKLRRLQKNPNSVQQYRYHANRGTILAHSGRFEEALSELETALALNPEAHFGRERFQVDLIRYIKAAKKRPKLWSEHNFLNFAKPEAVWLMRLTEASFDPPARETKSRLLTYSQEELDKAKQGIIGMLRFGGPEGPELYRALGDVCACQRNLNLAWWLYKYALHKNHPAQADINKAIESIERHWSEAGYGSVPNQADFEKVLANGQQWQETFQKLENEALERSEDPADPNVLENLLSQTNQAVPTTGLTNEETYLSKALSLNIGSDVFFLGGLLLLGLTIVGRFRKNRTGSD